MGGGQYYSGGTIAEPLEINYYMVQRPIQIQVTPVEKIVIGLLLGIILF